MQEIEKISNLIKDEIYFIRYNSKKFGYFLNMILYCVSKTTALQRSKT